MVGWNGASRSLSVQLQILLAGADEKRSGVLDPVQSGLPPRIPAGRKLFLHEHGFEIAHRDCGFTVLPAGIGLVGQKSKQQTEFAGGAHQIIVAKQLGELLFEIAMGFGRLTGGAVESAQRRRADTGYKRAKVSQEQFRRGCSEHSGVRVPAKVFGNETPDVGPLDIASFGSDSKPRKVRRTEATGVQFLRTALQDAAVSEMRALRTRKLQREQSLRYSGVESTAFATHGEMITRRKQNQQVSEVTAAAISQLTEVL